MNKIISIIILLCNSIWVMGQGQIKRPQTQNSQQKVESRKPEGNINGHDYVDLGLPSGLKWAKCNVGANKPEDSGNYYAWGETKQKSYYGDTNSKTENKSSSELKNAGIINSSGNLTLSNDAARQNWGSSWRMPTYSDFVELREKCIWRWTSRSGKNGYEVTGPNGKSIFLPASGYKWESRYFYKVGNYWSSTLPPDDWFESAAYKLEIDLYNNDKMISVSPSGRSLGLTIRAVSK